MKLKWSNDSCAQPRVKPMSNPKNHVLDSAMLRICRVKEIVQFTNENKEVQRD